jgi:hypothetical protein
MRIIHTISRGFTGVALARLRPQGRPPHGPPPSRGSGLAEEEGRGGPRAAWVGDLSWAAQQLLLEGSPCEASDVHGDHLLAVANLEDECLQPRPDYPVRPSISRGQGRPGTASLDVDVGGSLQVSCRRL